MKFQHWILGAALVCASLAAAAQNDGPPPQDHPHGPPPEAVAACKGKAEGTRVQFTGRHGDTVTGVCRKMDDVLAAMPEGTPPQR